MTTSAIQAALPPTFFEPRVADAKAAEMASDPDDDWTYRAEHYDSGWSAVLIFDEDEVLVGKL